MLSANEVTRRLYMVKNSNNIDKALHEYFPTDVVCARLDESFGTLNLAFLSAMTFPLSESTTNPMIEYFIRHGIPIDEETDMSLSFMFIGKSTLLSMCVTVGWVNIAKMLLRLGAKKFNLPNLSCGFDMKCLCLIDRADLIDKEKRASINNDVLDRLDDRKNRYFASLTLLALKKYKNSYIDKNLFVEMAKYLWANKCSY